MFYLNVLLYLEWDGYTFLIGPSLNSSDEWPQLNLTFNLHRSTRRRRHFTCVRLSKKENIYLRFKFIVRWKYFIVLRQDPIYPNFKNSFKF